MFGIGVPEFFTVLILALIVLGPERLPIAMRTVGRWVRRLREQTREFRQEFAEEFSILYEEMDVLRQEAETTRKELADIRSDLTDTLQGAADDVNAAGSGVVQDLRETIESIGKDNLPSLHSPFFAPDPEPTLRATIESMGNLALALLQSE